MDVILSNGETYNQQKEIFQLIRFISQIDYRSHNCGIASIDNNNLLKTGRRIIPVSHHFTLLQRQHLEAIEKIN